MDQLEEEVVTEEPQLHYWNPWRKSRSVFTTSVLPPSTSFSPLHYAKMGSQVPVFCESFAQSSVPSPVCDNYQPIEQELFANINDDASNLYLPQTVTEALPSQMSTLIPLETVAAMSQSFVVAQQEDGSTIQIKQELEDDMIDENVIQELRDDIFTFNSIDEALDSIDSSRPHSNLSAISINAMQCVSNTMGLTNEKHEEVVKAAKSLFSKRTRTLYHWLYPDTSKNKLKATVTAAWETLSEEEKHFYISQVLGRFGLQASSLMVNPQLGGIKYIPNETEKVVYERKKSAPQEDQRAVDSLFDSCEDAGNWASYTEPTPLPPATKPKSERKRGRKYQKRREENDSVVTEKDRSKNVRKRAKKSKKSLKENIATIEEDPELTKELEKFRLITEAAEEDIWGDVPDPEELFADLGF